MTELLWRETVIGRARSARTRTVIRRRHLIPILGAVLTALVVCLGAVAQAPPAAASSGKKGLTSHQKKKARNRLQRQIRRDPRTVLKKGFLKKAQATDLTLPLTLRLKKSDRGPIDDALAVVWDSATWAWPAGFTQLTAASSGDPAPGGLVPLDGRATVDVDFGNDTSGYGGLGAVETTNGRHLQFSSEIASPIPVTGLPSCEAPGSPGVTDPTIPAVQLTRMNLVTGEDTNGLLSLFGGTARVSLHARLATTTTALDSTCGGAFGDLPPGRYEQDSSTPPDDAIVPISFDATFRISPAIDADGKMRLGVLTLPPGESQPTTFARISTCIQQTLSGPCSVVRFPARLSMSQLNAEVLVGDQTQ